MCCVCYEPSNELTSCNHCVCSTCIKKIHCCPMCRTNLYHFSQLKILQLWFGILLFSTIIIIVSFSIYNYNDKYAIFVYIFGITASIISVNILTHEQVNYIDNSAIVTPL